MSKFKVGDRIVSGSMKGTITSILGVNVYVSFDGISGEPYRISKHDLTKEHTGYDQILSFIQANPRISKDALIEGIKEIIKNK